MFLFINIIQFYFLNYFLGCLIQYYVVGRGGVSRELAGANSIKPVFFGAAGRNFLKELL